MWEKYASDEEKSLNETNTITSKTLKDKYAIEITDDDFETGSLMKESNIRTNKVPPLGVLRGRTLFLLS